MTTIESNMALKRPKSVSDFCVVLTIWLSISSCVLCQAPTQRPIAAATTAKPGNIGGGVTNKPVAGNAAGAGSIVVEIQTPPTTPSNINSVINAKPAENRPIAPQTTPRPSIGVTVSSKPGVTPAKPNVGVTVSSRPGVTPAKPGVTPAKPNVGVTVSSRPGVTPAKPNVGVTVSSRPGVTPAKPNVGVTVSSRPGVAPTTPSKLPLPGSCQVMATKTGYLTVPNDPCSYVSCIRADSFLHCAQVKCDPGQAFSQATGRCIASNQCVAKKSK